MDGSQDGARNAGWPQAKGEARSCILQLCAFGKHGLIGLRRVASGAAEAIVTLTAAGQSLPVGPNPRLAVRDSSDFAWKWLILLLFWPCGRSHPPDAGNENGGSAGF